MKNKLSFFVWLALLLAGVSNSIAQNALFEIDELSTDNTLIREYRPKIDIIYNKSVQSSFLYVDRTTMQVFEAEVFVPAEVTDMEIVGDTLFFCAQYLGNIYYGFFDIYSTFFGSASINVYEIPFHPIDVIGGNTFNSNVSLSKLEVYRTSVSIHIFMIADVVFNNPLTTDYSVIMEALYNGATWDVNIESEPDRVYYFDDLTVTDNYLWVVGHKNGGRGEYMHGYRLTNSSVIGNNMCSPGYMQYWATNNDYYYPISRPLIETLGGDSVVVACYGMTSGGFGTIISGYTVGCSVSLIKREIVQNVTQSSKFRDLKYNPRSKYLYLMPDHNFSTVVDVIYMFDLAGGIVKTNKPFFSEIHSLDIRHSDGGAIVSGETYNFNLGEWKLFPTDVECVSINSLTPIINLIPPFDSFNTLRNTTLIPDNILIRHTIKKHPIEVICGYSKPINSNNQ